LSPLDLTVPELEGNFIPMVKEKIFLIIKLPLILTYFSVTFNSDYFHIGYYKISHPCLLETKEILSQVTQNLTLLSPVESNGIIE
jgi:hypothetical protein